MRALPGRGGMTLLELLVALTIFGVVISVSLAFLTQQNTQFQTALERMGALRNVRYAVTVLAQDLETLGTNVPGQQPALIYADTNVITFSADYATNVSGDPFAIFYNPGAPAGQVRAPADTFRIPTTAVLAADTTYRVAGGVLSPAEMLSFFFVPDSSTSRTDDYVLFRQVNGNAPELVARGLLRVDDEPFFTYQREAIGPGGALVLQTVPDSLLPIHHSEPLHLSPGDTAASALADSVRAVRVALSGTNGRSGSHERTAETVRWVRFPNAAQARLTTCGSAPLFGDTLVATPTTLGTGDLVIELTWGAAIDEHAGEADVVRYVLWRRENGSSDWGEPYIAVPAGETSYTYVDSNVTSGTVYEFAVAAQDCTPTLSSLVSSGLVIP